jgi:hypothetical protein
MFGWLPWKRREAIEAVARSARLEDERRQHEALAAEVDAYPYRICERADGLWRVEYAYVWWWIRSPPSIQWKTARHASRLPSREAAIDAVQRLLSPLEIRVGSDGQPEPGEA